MKILGIDPGLRHTGWGIVSFHQGRLSHIAHGTISPKAKLDMAERLLVIQESLYRVIQEFAPEHAAIEEIFVNKNPASTLKLGMARGVAFVVPAKQNIPVTEYATNLVKKSLVGTGHASKEQIKMMVGTLLPGIQIESEDAADALAVSICHAHHYTPSAHYAQGASK